MNRDRESFLGAARTQCPTLWGWNGRHTAAQFRTSEVGHPGGGSTGPRWHCPLLFASLPTPVTSWCAGNAWHSVPGTDATGLCLQLRAEFRLCLRPGFPR